MRQAGFFSTNLGHKSRNVFKDVQLKMEDNNKSNEYDKG